MCLSSLMAVFDSLSENRVVRLQFSLLTSDCRSSLSEFKCPEREGVFGRVREGGDRDRGETGREEADRGETDREEAERR